MTSARVLATQQARDAAKQLLALTGSVKEQVRRVLQHGGILANPHHWEGSLAGTWRNDWGRDANHLNQAAAKLDELEHTAQQVVEDIFKADGAPPGAGSPTAAGDPPPPGRKSPEEPGFFERGGATLGRALDGAVERIRDSTVALAEPSWQVIEDNANLIAAVSDVTADLSTMVGVAGDVVGIVPTPLTAGVVDPALNAVSIWLQLVALGGHGVAQKAGADVHGFTIAMDGYGLASGTVGAFPGPAGLGTDLAGLDAQRRVESEHGGKVPTFWGDLGDYWVPKNLDQVGSYARNERLAVPFWNAIVQGHRKDVEAREGGG